MLRKVFDQYTILPVGQAIVDNHSVIKINEAGYTILTHLLTDISYEDLLKAVCRDFDASEYEQAEVKEFLDSFIAPLKINYIILEKNDN